MSTITPGRLFKATDAASFVALSQQNWVIASEGLFRRVPTYQDGTPNTLSGPPNSGAWNVGDWRFLAGPEPGAVRLHRDGNPEDAAAKRAGHRHRRSGQVPDRDHKRRRPQMTSRGAVVGGPDRGRHILKGRLPRTDAHRPTGTRRPGRGH